MEQKSQYFVVRNFRFLRVPYFYLTCLECSNIRFSAMKISDMIGRIHHGIPLSRYPDDVIAYMNHISFVRWTFDKSHAEIIKRGIGHQRDGWFKERINKVRALKSLGIEDFLPPTEENIAEDLIWLLEKYAERKSAPDKVLSLDVGGTPFPRSYLNLIKKFYKYDVPKDSLCRIDFNSTRSYESDIDWYFAGSPEITSTLLSKLKIKK